MLAYRNKLKATTTQDNGANTNLTEQENASLQCLGGYVLHYLYKKCAKKHSPENEEAMAILKAGKLEEGTESQRLVSSLNRGGLWCVTRPAQSIFLYTEQYFRQFTFSSCSQEIDISAIAE